MTINSISTQLYATEGAKRLFPLLSNKVATLALSVQSATASVFYDLIPSCVCFVGLWGIGSIIYMAGSNFAQLMRKEGKRFIEQCDSSALRDLYYKNFDRHSDNPREFMRRADEAVNRLLDQKGFTREVKLHLRDLCQFYKKCFLPKTDLIFGNNEQNSAVLNMIAGIFKGSFHTPGYYFTQRRALEEEAWHKKYVMLDFS